MPASEGLFEATALVPGTARGDAIRLSEPLNAWGDLDPETGVIVHHGHPQYGQSLAGKVLVMRESRGSGGNAQVFAQVWANKKGPLAVVLAVSDYILCVGAVVSSELYGVECPVVVLSANDYESLSDGDDITVSASADRATVTVQQ